MTMEQAYIPMNDSSSGSVQVHRTMSLPVPHSLPPSSSLISSEGYLTPTSPSHSQQSRPRPLPDAPVAGFRRPKAHSQPARLGGAESLRFNALAEAGDEAEHQGLLLSVPAAYPRSSEVYECIDEGHNTQRQGNIPPTSTKQGDSSSSGFSSATTATAYTPETVSDSHERLNTLRSHLNPNYDALVKCTPQADGKMCSCKLQLSTQRQLRYLWCGFTILTIITVVLLAFISYVFFVVIPGLQDAIANKEDRMIVEAASASHVQVHEGDEIQLAFASNQTLKTETSHTDSLVVSDMLAELNATVHTLGSQLQVVSSDLQQQIHTISLTPGPQGPPGAGNLSRCFYSKYSSMQALPGPYSTTAWFPRDGSSQLKNNVVMSATCGVEGGTQQFIETKDTSSHLVQYRCRCDGHRTGEDRRVCTIHLVLCPRVMD